MTDGLPFELCRECIHKKNIAFRKPCTDCIKGKNYETIYGKNIPISDYRRGYIDALREMELDKKNEDI